MSSHARQAEAGALLVALAAFLWGLSGGLGGVLIARGWSPILVSFYGGAIGLLFCLAWLALRPRDSGLGSLRLWLWSALAGVGVAGNFAFYMFGIDESSLAVTATLMYCAPVFVYGVSFLLGLERVTALKSAAIVLVMIGIVLLTRAWNSGASDITPVGIGAGLLAGVSYAGFIFAFKFASPHGSPQAVLSIAFLVFVLLLAWPVDGARVLAVPGSPEWPLFLALGVLGAGVSFMLYVFGLDRTAPAVAAVVAMTEPVTAALFGVAVLDEVLRAPQLLGMALILATVTALSVHSGHWWR